MQHATIDEVVLPHDQSELIVYAKNNPVMVYVDIKDFGAGPLFSTVRPALTIHLESIQQAVDTAGRITLQLESDES